MIRLRVAVLVVVLVCMGLGLGPGRGSGSGLVLLGAETWEFNADNVSNVRAPGRESVVLEGSAVIRSETRIIRAEKLTLTGSDFSYITGEHGISVTDLENDFVIRARTMEYDRGSSIIRLRQQVELYDNKEETTARCEALDYNEDTDTAVMQIAVRIIKDDIVSRGEFATFRRKEKILEMSGQPTVWQRENQYTADLILVNLATEEITLLGNVEGELTTEDEEEEASDGGQDGAPDSQQVNEVNGQSVP